MSVIDSEKPVEVKELDIPHRINAALESMGISDRVTGEFYDYIVECADDIAEEGDRRCSLGEEYREDFFGFYPDPYEEDLSQNFPFHSFEKPDVTFMPVHFTPTIPKVGGDFKDIDLDNQASNFAEREGVMAQGVLGVITFLTLVEASIFDKPDVVIAATNEKMAKIAERFGIKRLSTYFDEHLKGKYEGPTELDLTLFMDYLDEPYEIHEGRELFYKGPAWWTWLWADVIRRVPDPFMRKYLNENIIQRFAEDEFVFPTQEGYGSYDDFKNAAIEFYKGMGKKLIERYVGHLSVGDQSLPAA
jgi:hypothetical protein